ncbi:GNAT family N-acetyltransferase [Streptomyces sp. NPDC001922]|uniref:GNAT family N-acetyltransferase n=1 Tax=Streptomyces sp. NPDC001922 TaxID=3364624 RepID=UPI0036B81F37
MTPAVRQYAGAPDLRVLQELTQRVWSPTTAHHIGDLAWGRLLAGRAAADWPLAVWEADGRTVAWAWAHFPDDLRLQVDPEHPELFDPVLSWFGTIADGRPCEIDALDTEPELRAALLRHGYRQQRDRPYFTTHLRPLTGPQSAGQSPTGSSPAVTPPAEPAPTDPSSADSLPAPVLPDGFTVRALRGLPDLDRRVAVQRAAWNSTRVTADSYREVMAAWPYRPDLDWVVEAPDGRFVANCLIWYDDVHRAGLIEPVGTHPEFRRRGLARAVCLAALHALRAMGGTQAVVRPRGDADYPVPQTLYRNIGFRPGARTHTYRRPGTRR